MSATETAEQDAATPEAIPFRPIGDRILVRLFETEEMTTAGGIVLPETVGQREKPKKGLVLAVGNGIKRTRDGVEEREEMDVATGDIVVFSQYGGVDLDLSSSGDRKPYLILRQSDVLGILELPADE